MVAGIGLDADLATCLVGSLEVAREAAAGVGLRQAESMRSSVCTLQTLVATKEKLSSAQERQAGRTAATLSKSGDRPSPRGGISRIQAAWLAEPLEAKS